MHAPLCPGVELMHVQTVCILSQVRRHHSRAPVERVDRRSAQGIHAPLGILTQGNEWNGVFVPFWPANAGLIDWPGRSHLSYQLVETFVHRWNNAGLS